MGLIYFVGIALSGGALTYLLFGHKFDRSAVRDSLRRIETYEIETLELREQELAEPLSQRLVLPVVGALVGLARRFTPADYVSKTRHKLVLAGHVDPAQVDRFLAARVLALLAVPGSFILVFGLAHIAGMKGTMMVLLLSVAGILGPNAILTRRIAARQKAIQRTLPEVLDLLTISVEAGLGFEQALDRAVDNVPGPLSDELGRMMGEMRAGARRADALRAFDERTGVPDVHSFTLAILQADAFGVSITRVLRAQADEMRVRRRQLAQEAAAKAPVKMLVPMVFCIFPALFAVVLGPAAINIATNFH